MHICSATVAFLAVPGIDHVTRMAGLISVLCALGSITIGLYLVWRHQTQTKVCLSAFVPSNVGSY